MSTDANRDDNSYIFDPESSVEMARLQTQDRIATKAMGGTLSGLTAQEINTLSNVLDIACGPGQWVLDVAFEHPHIDVAGIDKSKLMIEYANASARSQNIINASFGVMDILGPLDFTDGCFDLVNVRFVGGVLPRNAWKPFIAECTRLLCPGGILRLTEVVDWGSGSGPAFERMRHLLNQAMWRLDYGFSPDGDTIGMTPVLPRLLRDAGFQNIHLKGHALELSPETETWADSYHNYQIAYRNLQPVFVDKTGLVEPEEFERVYQQMLIEMNGDAFCGVWHFMSAWGTSPDRS